MEAEIFRTCAKTVSLLLLLMGINAAGELGHYLIGVVSKSMAQDIGYGDKSCLPVTSKGLNSVSGPAVLCKDYKNETRCGEHAGCEWNYDGQGSEYQILAGPAFIACFTIAGIGWGVLADKFNLNRVYLLTISATAFSLAIGGTAFASEYWHLVILRMLLAACAAATNPLAAGMIGDVFSQDKRALAMGIFNWGIFIGYGSSFAVGSYISDTTFFQHPWRLPFFLCGFPGVIIVFIFVLAVTEPRKEIKSISTASFGLNRSTDNNSHRGSKPDSIQVAEVEEESFLTGLKKRPEIFIFGLAACIRESAGYCWGYNSALYFQTYYPAFDAGWWLTIITIVAGIMGCVLGGYISDHFVNRFGLSNRSLVIAGSQLISTPFSVGLLYLPPPYAFLFLFLTFISFGCATGVTYALLVELAPSHQRSSIVAVALFVISNVGGNLPILIDPLSKMTNFRSALLIQYSGALFTCSVLFFIYWLLSRKRY